LQVPKILINKREVGDMSGIKATLDEIERNYGCDKFGNFGVTVKELKKEIRAAFAHNRDKREPCEVADCSNSLNIDMG
jgi:hypothetical protein